MDIQVRNSLIEFQKALEEKDPEMPTLLGKIHSTLKQYPENVTLLTDDEICQIFRGIQLVRGIVIAQGKPVKESKPASVGKVTKEAKALTGKAKLAGLIAKLNAMQVGSQDSENDKSEFDL